MTDTKKKVLIVDDDKLLSGALEQLFVDAGFDTKVLLEGTEVEAIIDSWKPDVTLLDIMLPGKTGVEITKDLCKAHQGICDQLVIMTSLNDSGYLAQALELGGNSFGVVPADVCVQR